MSNVAVVDFLDHHGVKGQKWGVRRAQKQLAKADAKWQENIYSIHGAIAVHNAVADKMNNGGIDRLNNDKRFKGHKLLDIDTGEPIGPRGKAYLKEYEKMSEKFTKEAIDSVHGISPSGTLRAKLDTSNPEQWQVTISSVDAQHADDILPTLVFEIDHDDNGQVIYTKKIKTEIAQSDDDMVLTHHGIKGQKWGVRRKNLSSTSSHLSVLEPQSHDSENAQRHLTRAKTSGVRALSNKDIQEVLTRANLEGQFSKINRSKVRKGADATAKILLSVGKQQATGLAIKGVTKGISKVRG